MSTAEAAIETYKVEMIRHFPIHGKEQGRILSKGRNGLVSRVADRSIRSDNCASEDRVFNGWSVRCGSKIYKIQDSIFQDLLGS